WVMPAEGGGLEQVVTGARNGVPSPDGSRVAFTGADGSALFVDSLAGAKRRQIRSGGKTAFFSALIWSPDGKRIAFQRTEFMPRAELNADPGAFLTLNQYRYSYESVEVDSGRLAASAKDFVMESPSGLNDGSVLFL